jgi:CDK-activating kinase assembly factor MAT1
MANRKPIAGSTLPTISNDPRSDSTTCPICRTTRYLNRDLVLQIDPECYHPMCTNCVASHFKDGPAQCPYQDCFKTLRSRNFRTPRFDDLNVEREVDIRKHVAGVFTQTEEDFEDLRSWNDHLNMVEDLTEALVGGDERSRNEADAKIRQWEAVHKSEIAASRKRRGEAEEIARRRVEEEQSLAAERRRKAALEDQEEKRKEADLREEMFAKLEHGQAGQAGQTMHRILLKRRGMKSSMPASDSEYYSGPGLSIRGLKRKAAPDDYDSRPYDPFGGVAYVPQRYVAVETRGLQAYEEAEWLDNLTRKDDFRVGGYDFGAYVERLLFEGSWGLGVFVEEEKGRREKNGGAMEVDGQPVV